MSQEDYGLVTRINREDGKILDIWRYGNNFMLELSGEILPLTCDPLFQEIARALYESACEVGRLRAAEIDLKRKLRKLAGDAPFFLGRSS